MSGEALRARAAESRQAGDDVIARPRRRHLGADRLHDPGAEDERPVDRVPTDAVDDVQIAVTDARRRGAYEHLAAPRLVDLH